MPIRLRMPFITYRSLIFISSEPISKKPRLVHVWSETGFFFRVLLYLRTEWAMAYLKHQQQYYPYQIIPIYLKNRFFCSSWWIGLMCDLLFWSAVRFIRNSMIAPSHFLVVVDFLSTSHCSIFYVIVPVVWAISALAVCLAHINSKIADRICPVYVITIRVSKHTYIRWSMPLQFSGLMAHISTNIYRPLSWLPMTITFHSLLYDFTIHYLYS